MRSVFAFLAGAVLVGAVWAQEPDSLRYMGLIQRANKALQEEEFEVSARFFKEALSIQDTEGAVWRDMGLVLMRIKRYDEAIAAFQRTMKLGAFEGKYEANAYYNIACCYALQGDKERAFQNLQLSLDNGLRFLSGPIGDPDLAPLKKDPRWETMMGLKDVSKMSRNEGWKYDLWFLDREMRRIHFDPYRMISKAELDKKLTSLRNDIPKLSDAQLRIRFMQYVRLFGDGHTRLYPAPGSLRMPVQLFWFKEGLYVTAAAPDHAELAGAEVLEIEGRSPRSLLPVLDSITFQDNPQSILHSSPTYFTTPAILEGLDLGKNGEETTYKLKLKSGETVTRTLKAIPLTSVEGWKTSRDGAPNPTPLYLANRAKAYWYQHLPEEKMIYFQYNAVREESDKSIAQTAADLERLVEEKGVEYLVMDVRFNGGGNTFLSTPFTQMLFRMKPILRPGHLFVITGRQTFSAAQNFVTDIERGVGPLFVGEATGSSPNFVGETIAINLPYSKMTGSISDLYWQRSWPMDNRLWITPDLPAAPTFAAFSRNEDPAMEAIRAFIRSQKGEERP